MTRATVNFGDKLKCAQTGIEFTAKAVGYTTTYASDDEGNVFCDKGVFDSEHERIKRAVRGTKLSAYLSVDGNFITGWKGWPLMNVTGYGSKRLTRTSFTHGARIRTVHAVDAEGNSWYGESSPGCYIRMRKLAKRSRHISKTAQAKYQSELIAAIAAIRFDAEGGWITQG